MSPNKNVTDVAKMGLRISQFPMLYLLISVSLLSIMYTIPSWFRQNLQIAWYVYMHSYNISNVVYYPCYMIICVNSSKLKPAYSSSKALLYNATPTFTTEVHHFLIMCNCSNATNYSVCKQWTPNSPLEITIHCKLWIQNNITWIKNCS